jgi:hypothetical protein
LYVAPAVSNTAVYPVHWYNIQVSITITINGARASGARIAQKC